MAKGTYLTPRIKKLVAKIYLKNRAIGPTKAREELLKEIKKEGLDKNFGPDFPSVSSVSKLLTEYKDNDENRPPELKELDKPWSIGALGKFNIPFDVVPMLLELKEHFSKEGSSFTVREARWASNLMSLIHPKILSQVEALSQWSYKYALWERLSEVTGIDLDTSPLDKIINDYAEAWAAYPSLWDTLERQEGFAFTVGLLQYLMELRYAATQRKLTKDEENILACAERSELELAFVYTELTYLDDLDEAVKASKMVDRIIDTGADVTIESAEKTLGKEDANWLMSCLEKGYNRAIEALGIQEEEAQNERSHSTERQP